MGKIRVSTLGSPEEEKKQKEDARLRRLAKKAAKEGVKVEAVVKETEKKISKEPKKAKPKTAKTSVQKDAKKTDTGKKKEAHVRTNRYLELRKSVDPKKYYTVEEAFVLVKQTSKTKFTGTVEAHINLNRKLKIKGEKGVRVERKFPLAHAVLGKSNQTENELKEALANTIKLIGKSNITKVVINSSMGPGIKVLLGE